jgi:plasmid stabilization system protein ParE
MLAKFSELAIADLKNIADYLIDNASVNIALSVTDSIEATINESILDNPKIGMGVNFSGKEMRYFPAMNYDNYNIFYTVEDDHIFIVRILYGKRDIVSIFEENEE